MKIMVVNHFDVLSPRVKLEVETLLEQGHQVHVMSFNRNLRKPTYSQGNRDGYRETSVPLGAPRGTIRLAFVLPWLYVKLFFALRNERPDIVHCTHLFLLPFCITFAKVRRARVVYDAYEMHAIDWAGYIPLCSRVTRNIIEILENWLVGHVDCVLTIDSVGGFLANRYRRANTNVVVLYNVSKKEVVVQPERIEFLRKKYEGFQVLAYVGGAYEAKGMLKALEAIRLVKEKIPTVKLLFIGKVDDRNGRANKVIQTANLEEYVEFIPWLPYEEMLHHLHVAKIGLALHQPVGRFLLVSRGNGRKFFTYMQAGLPIIAPSFGEIGLVVREEGCGLLVDTTDPAQVAEAIISLLNDPDRARAMGERGRRAIQEKYNWEKEQEKLLRAYRAMFEERGATESPSRA